MAKTHICSGGETSQPVQSPQQQAAQQSGHNMFRPRGCQFKKKSGSSSSGSGSSSGSSSKVEFCGQCGVRHAKTHYVGVQGGSSRGRYFPAPQQRLGEPQYRPFQYPGPSRFGQSSQPQFSGPQFAQFLVDWAVKKRIRPPELETSICDAKYHVSLFWKLSRSVRSDRRSESR
ncbi:hypothetical protein F511_30068 [Dorcoceras hygrometricum]|uniref:Uncharacterized protein n=1 Tax=Dorcoceras hygrometricum TaxID=472368 RepID=A0A2Z7CXF2_9LAMI|nr:hypothetical protein F511_30068 [Dorcoceras hygrometricum]